MIAHDETRKFDAEDQRLLESLAMFAATAYQVRLSISAQASINQALQAEIAERQRAEDALREANRRKSEFLAMLAHELRNPLSPIRNALKILQLVPNDVKTTQAMLDMMERQVTHTVRLVDDLLDVSRIDRGTIQLRKEPVDVASVVNQAVEAVGPLYESMNHELTVTLPTKPSYLNADPTRLAQVMSNLLNNAGKFTDRGGRIRLSVEREGNQVVIRVGDNGIGMDAGQLPRIFQMFAQVDTSLERSREGLGIGLTLVKNLVELHDGTVEAHSAGVGQCSEFVVRLPLHPGPLPPLKRPSDAKPVAPTQRRVLVVDDNQDAALSLAMLLRMNGHEVHTAHDGLKAIDLAATYQPDVVLLDIGLPKLNGYEVARRIREQQPHKGVMLVALTGWGQEEDRRRSEKAGFDAHMVKPVNLDVLSNLLVELRAS